MIEQKIQELIDVYTTLGIINKEQAFDGLMLDLQSLQKETNKEVSKKCPGCGVEGVGCICAILNPIT